MHCIDFDRASQSCLAGTCHCPLLFFLGTSQALFKDSTESFGPCANRGSSKKSEKICVARWDYAIHKSSFSELSYLAFSQNSLSNSPRFASLAYSYFVIYISNHTDKILQKLHMRSSATVILHANPMKTQLKNYF